MNLWKQRIKIKQGANNMANAKEIQERMSSINDTLKITNAMYMISSSKLKKSKKMLQDTRALFL